MVLSVRGAGVVPERLSFFYIKVTPRNREFTSPWESIIFRSFDACHGLRGGVMLLVE